MDFSSYNYWKAFSCDVLVGIFASSNDVHYYSSPFLILPITSNLSTFILSFLVLSSLSYCTLVLSEHVFVKFWMNFVPVLSCWIPTCSWLHMLNMYKYVGNCLRLTQIFTQQAYLEASWTQWRNWMRLPLKNLDSLAGT